MKLIRYSVYIGTGILGMLYHSAGVALPQYPRVMCAAGNIDTVRSHIMAAWKVIVVGRSIAPHYMVHLNQRLFDALLMLHTSLWHAVQVVSSYDRVLIADLLHAFHQSCEDFCDLQEEQHVYHIRSMAYGAQKIWREMFFSAEF